MNFQFQHGIKTDPSGFEQFLALWLAVKNCEFEVVEIDFSNVGWFDANLTALLGPIVRHINANINIPSLTNLTPPVRRILSKNRFLSFMDGSKPTLDSYGTTIAFQEFKPTETARFAEYLDRELLSHSELPSMSERLKKKIRQSISELFVNAATHGGGDRVFCCGQYYPAKKRLDFSVANLGRSIQMNVEAYYGQSYGGVETIEWAVTEGHTTRTGNIPGGLGLSLLRKFLTLNKGRLQIFSGNGYWCEDCGTPVKHSFADKFPGTLVNVEINIGDTNSYILSSEIKNSDPIF